jgi:hypothetical protein
MSQQVENQSQNSSENALSKRFEQERRDWVNKIQEFSDQLKHISQIGELMTDVYSQRQIALEYSHTLMEHLIKLNKIVREKRHERYVYYTYNFDVRLDKDSKESYINNDISYIIEKKDVVQNHFDYMRDTIKTIDNIVFAIKHRISLEEYRRN